jgi:membrane associated rhomboid family serine protease
MNHYSYGPGFAIYGWSPMVKRLIIINCAVFLFGSILALIDPALLYRFLNFFGLVPVLVVNQLHFWQLFTYMFLHGGFFHLLFNMFVLLMFGSEIERMWGKREFLRYYFITGVGAAIVYSLATFIIPSLNPTIPTIGASGAIFGILVAFAMLFPNRLIYLYFLFPIKAKHLVILFVVLELWATITYSDSGIANVAHLGGMLVGYAYIRGNWNIDLFFDRLKEKARKSKFKIRVVDDEDDGWFDDERDDREEEEVNRILDKILSEGIDSLTDDERRILDRAGKGFRQNR